MLFLREMNEASLFQFIQIYLLWQLGAAHLTDITMHNLKQSWDNWWVFSMFLFYICMLLLLLLFECYLYNWCQAIKSETMQLNVVHMHAASNILHAVHKWLWQWNCSILQILLHVFAINYVYSYLHATTITKNYRSNWCGVFSFMKVIQTTENANLKMMMCVGHDMGCAYTLNFNIHTHSKLTWILWKEK